MQGSYIFLLFEDHYVNLTKKFSDMMKGDIDENGMCKLTE